MTLYALLEAGQAVDSTLLIYNVRPGGWVKGPNDDVQCIGKMVSYKSDSYVKYDIFAVR